VTLGAFDHGVNDGRPLSGGFAADEQPVPFSNCRGTDAILDQIMPRPDLCRVRKLKARIPVVRHSIPYSHAA
jgi:hypothetical protein